MSFLEGDKSTPHPWWDPTSWAAPKDCLCCGRSRLGPVCTQCWEQLPVQEDGCPQCGQTDMDEALPSSVCSFCETLGAATPEAACSLYLYHGVARELMHLIKFGGYWRLLSPLINERQKEIHQRLDFAAYDCLVPIPSGPRGRMRRFFNPAGEIANQLAKLSGTPVQRMLRQKRWWVPRQMGHDRKQRRRQAEGKYRALGQVPERIILVDDVFTTGATLISAAKALRKAGARHIAWFMLMRTV